MKILMVSMLFPPDFGGAPVQSIRLAKALKGKNIEVEFVTDNGSKPTVKNDLYDGLNVTRLKTYSDVMNSKLREIIFSIKLLTFVIFRPDIQVVHFHSIRGLESLLFPVLSLLGKKVLLKLTLVDSDDPLTFKKRKLLSPFYMWGLKASHSMVAISEELVKRSLAAGMPIPLISKIFNGFDEQNFFIPDDSLKSELRKKLAIPEHVPVFVSIGKVEHRKGYDLLVEAFAIIQEKMPDAHLIIIGPGDNSENEFYNGLLNTINQLEISNVSFAGKKNNVDEYLKAGDCFLFCSRQEGFGTVLIEAMACGLPTIAMNIEGITEDIITDPRLGRICYSKQPQDFADLTLELIESNDKELVKSAVKDLTDVFSIDHISDTYIRLYKSLI